jgi:hypothetical protein
MTEFLIKKEDFDKVKKAFDSTPPNKRKQVDVDAYNKAIEEYNKAVNVYNKTNESLNNNRSKVITNWETTRKKFMDVHVPHKL